MRKSFVRDYWIRERMLSRLQDVSSETEETSKGSSGESEGLVATGGGDGGWLSSAGGHWGGGGANGASGGGSWGTWDNWGGAVGVWDAGRDNNGRGGHWLDDGARAVGDGQGGAGSGSVGDTVEGQLGGGRADSGVGSVDLSGVHNGAVGVTSSGGGCCESENGGDGVLHLDGWYYLLGK